MVTTGSSIARQRVWSAWTFLAPSLVVLALVAGWPLLRTFWFSLTDAELGGMEPPHFVGLANYRELFADWLWWLSGICLGMGAQAAIKADRLRRGIR